MNLNIRKYNPALDYNHLEKLIESEGVEWKSYLRPNYLKALENSITYVAYIEGQLCGYCRSINDSGIFIWVVDLLVHENRRGLSIGKKLLESVSRDCPDIDVYVMSDVDSYYQKLGYVKEGSIFKVAPET